MKKYKINIDRLPVTNSEIEAFKDFNSIMKNFNEAHKPDKKLHLKNIVIASLGGVAAILIIVLAYFSAFNKSSLPIVEEKSAFIAPPVKNWDLPFTAINISLQTDSIITLNSGSQVKFYKNSLVDESGEIINSGIEIRYREFPSPAEIFLAGIPMVYDSAGVQYTFESAGMIELYAYHRNRPLKFREGFSADVTLISSYNSPDYNLYYLDTTKRNWIFKGKDVLSLNSNSKKRKPKNSVLNEKEALTITKPQPPVKADTAKWQLKLDLVKGEFPELEVYSNTTFEIDESFRPLDKNHTKKVWEDVALEAGPKASTYFITFRIKSDSCRYLIKPVLSDKDYALAKARYDSLYNLYSTSLIERKNSEALSRIPDSVKKVSISGEAFDNLYEIKRSFSIQNFGIWNCDRFRSYPNERRIYPTFMIDNTEYRQTTYHADCTFNSLTTIYPNSEIRYNPKAKNLVWMITYNNTLAVFTDEDFRNLTNNRNQNLKMRKVSKEISSAEDFIKLYINNFVE